MKIVLDTNVILSALLTQGKARSLIYNLVAQGDEIILSTYILSEIESVLSRNKFKDSAISSSLIRQIKNTATILEFAPKFTTSKVRDSKDHPILQTAKLARADYLITGDNVLLTLENFGETKIVRINELLP